MRVRKLLNNSNLSPIKKENESKNMSEQNFECNCCGKPLSECKNQVVRCKWARAFDGHFNISCKFGKRANGQFHTDSTIQKTTWQFDYCPYCGRKIEICS